MISTMETPLVNIVHITRKAKGQHKCPGIPGQDNAEEKRHYYIVENI